MILVDSSVWIDYFKGKITDKTDWLDSAIGDKEIIVGDIILTEVLQGFQNDSDFRTAKKLLSDFPCMEMLGQDLAIKSALNYRFLKKMGHVKVNPTTCGLAHDMGMVQCDATGSIIKGNRKDLTQKADFLDCARYIINTFVKGDIERHQKHNFGQLNFR